MNDLISRQAAINAVMDEFKRVPTTAIRAKTRLESLPAAQPQMIKAHWVDASKAESRTYEYKCSECGFRLVFWRDLTNYCPNCGADMRGEADEQP